MMTGSYGSEREMDGAMGAWGEEGVDRRLCLAQTIRRSNRATQILYVFLENRIT